jgi:hypothetical protein
VTAVRMKRDLAIVDGSWSPWLWIGRLCGACSVGQGQGRQHYATQKDRRKAPLRTLGFYAGRTSEDDRDLIQELARAIRRLYVCETAMCALGRDARDCRAEKIIVTRAQVKYVG